MFIFIVIFCFYYSVQILKTEGFLKDYFSGISESFKEQLSFPSLKIRGINYYKNTWRVAEEEQGPEMEWC